MRAYWMGLLFVLGCDDDHADTVRDAALRDAAVHDDEMRDATSSLLDSGLVLPDTAVAVDAATCGMGEQVGTAVRYRATLEQLCAMLDRQGSVRCPTTRAAYAQALDCDGVFPVLHRQCVEDTIDRADNGVQVRWVFDRESGALVAARVNGELDCGRAFYHSDDLARTVSCKDVGVDCALCESGGERDAYCPEDVRAALPSITCAVASQASCTCAGGPQITDLPAPGTACEPSCARCQGDGTCWSECVCSVDGVYRWKLSCTE